MKEEVLPDGRGGLRHLAQFGTANAAPPPVLAGTARPQLWYPPHALGLAGEAWPPDFEMDVTVPYAGVLQMPMLDLPGL
ncbi:MAG: hypothetical protein P8076_05390 [Gammaproteobacteria bacterium]